MEQVCIRFPHVIEQINKELDFKTLVRFKEANRIVCDVINNQKQGRYFWTRIIHTNLPISNCIEFKEDWKNVFSKTENEYLKKHAINIQKFFSFSSTRRQRNWSPMHIASAQEDLELCQKIAEITEEKNPKLKDNWTPLHFASQSGNFEIFKFLSKNLQDKNPGTDIGITPLHFCAKNGNLEIYKFICKTAMDKNPAMDGDITPLHLAAKHNQIKVCEFICENVQNVSPMTRGNGDMFFSLTPMNLAINRVNVNVVKTIMRYRQGIFHYLIGILGISILVGNTFFHLLIFVLQLLCFILAGTVSFHGLIYENNIELDHEFLSNMIYQLELGYFSFPFAWPYLSFVYIAVLYYRDMYLTDYTRLKFDF